MLGTRTSIFLLSLAFPCFSFFIANVPGNILPRIKLSSPNYNSERNFISNEFPYNNLDERESDENVSERVINHNNIDLFHLKHDTQQSIPSLGAWRSLVIDEAPLSLASYLSGFSELSSFHEIKVMELWNEIKKRRTAVFTQDESSRVLEALKIAYVAFYGKKTHRCQELMIERAKGTALVLGELKAEANVVIAGIFHDFFGSSMTEGIDNDTLKVILGRRIGIEALALVEKCNSLPKLLAEKASYQGYQSELHILMLVSIAEDYRALYVRIAERLHTMRALKTLNLANTDKFKIAQEALHVYAPLAHKMNAMAVKGELEDLAFRMINPEMFEVSRCTQIAANKAFQDATDQIKEMLGNDEVMVKHNATYRLTYRIKDKYQLYLKMHRKNLSNLDEVRDALGLRVILETTANAGESKESFSNRGKELCYHLVNRFRSMRGWTPAVNGLKDYVAQPKENGYQSMHQYIRNTALGTNVEIQVRTKEMHVNAELGNAAHWYYKDSIYRPEISNSKIYKAAWRSEQQMHAKSPAELIGMAKQQLQASRVFVFLEDKSTVVNLRKGATALDAAFAVHSQLGLSAVQVKVKGRRTQLSGPLKNGDVITVETSQDGSITASPSWVKLVKSPDSIRAIRKYFKEKQREIVV